MSIEIRKVSKSFKEIKALQDVNISFGDEKIYGLFGRNGAGKSTLLNIIGNRISTYEGEIFIDGEKSGDIDKILRKIFIMSDMMLYPEGMRINKAFKWSKEFYPSFDMKYANELAEKFKLDLNRKVDKLSTGYTSIFKLIIALAVNTPYVFYDEPILGLDANHRELFYKELIANYAANPKTIVVSTHLIDEISSIVEHIVILKDGVTIVDETAQKLMDEGYTITGNANEVDAFIKNKRVLGIESLGLYKSAYIFEKIDKNNVPSTLEVSKLDLQKLFIELTNS